MKIGLALSGGGVRGAAHIGVLGCLRDNGIPVDLISGASAGAIAAGLYASGMDPDKMERFALGLNGRLLDYDVAGLIRSAMCALLCRKCRVTGLVRGERLHRALDRATGGKKLAEARIPLAVSATDLDGGDVILFVSDPAGLHDGRGVRYLSDAAIADAVSASAAIPMVFAVRETAGVRLVDGGVLENIPVNVLYHMGADLVVAVDLSRTSRSKPARGLLEVGQQSLSVMSRRLTELRTTRARVVITPDVSGIGTFDFEDIPLCVRRGYAAAEAAVELIGKAMDRYRRPEAMTALRPVDAAR